MKFKILIFTLLLFLSFSIVSAGDNITITPVNTTSDYAGGSFDFQVTDNSTPVGDKQVTLTVESTSVNAKTDNNGIVKFNNSNIQYYTTTNNKTEVFFHIPVGEKTVQIKSDSKIITTDLTVKQAEVELIADDYTGFNNDSFKIKAINKNTLEPMRNIVLKVNLPEVYYFWTNNEGIANINLTNFDIGLYEVNITVNDTRNMKSNPIKKQINIYDTSFTQLYYDIATADKTLTLTHDYTYTDGQTNGATINNALTIDGQGHTIDGAGVSAILNVYKETILKNIVFKNAYFKGQGAAIVASAKLTIINCTFINNKAEYGGAILSNEELVIQSSRFINNTADLGLAVYTQDSKLTVKDSEFTNNKGVQGKAIYSDSSTVTISDSKFTNNTGTVYSNAKTTISSSVFDNNDDVYGNIHILESSLILTSSTFTNNNAAVVLTSSSASINKNKYSGTVALSDSLKTTYLIKASTSKLTASYLSGDTLKIKLSKAIKNYYFTLKVYTGSKYKTYSVKTDSNGIASFKASSLSAGSHKIIISSEEDMNMLAVKPVTTTVKITKAKTTVNAPKVVNKYKKTAYFKVTVKLNKKAVKKVSVKVKVGKKTYNIKTDSKGIAKLNTKKLSVGKYKVVISSGNSNYKIAGKSTITVKR